MDWQKWCSFCGEIESKECWFDAKTNFPYEIHEQFQIFVSNISIQTIKKKCLFKREVLILAHVRTD